MRLLHTSDWHLGQLLHGHDRHAEHAAQVVHPAVRVAQGDPTLDHLGRLDEQ